ncbi:MAG TPA: DMT family transporter [Pseudolabrys sp.]|nr:DMT family transporter [Pseudolabrys sp.]
MSQAIVSPQRSGALAVPAFLLIAGFVLIWTSAFSVAKAALADCPPLLLLGGRFLLAGVLMLGAAAVSRASWTLKRRDVVTFALLGIANQAVYLGVGYIGLLSISSGLSVLIFSCNPIITGIVATFVLDERLTWARVVGLMLGIAGVAFIVESRLATGDDHLQGVMLTIIATISFVAGTIVFKRYAPKNGLWIGNGIQSLAAGIALLPFSLAFESIGDIVLSWRLLWAFLYLALIVSVVAYFLWFRILTISGATAASSYYFLMPPVGMLMGWLLLGERLELSDLLGIIPVVLGIYLVTRPSKAGRGRTT